MRAVGLAGTVLARCTGQEAATFSSSRRATAGEPLRRLPSPRAWLRPWTLGLGKPTAGMAGAGMMLATSMLLAPLAARAATPAYPTKPIRLLGRSRRAAAPTPSRARSGST
jgi:hypothetical protein